MTDWKVDRGELIQYTSAEEMANVYRDATAKIRELAASLDNETGRIKEAFAAESSYDFGISLHYRSSSESIDAILHQMKLSAWGAIIEKLNIRRLMSSKRIAELDHALGRGSRNYYGQEAPPDFPEITPENIIAVAQGYIMSATEFLEEAVVEEYEFWRPSRHRADYKRNSDWKLNRKIIRPWIVERNYGGGFRCNYSNGSHVTALDNIFRMLDGKGPVEEYKGPLSSAIETCPDGKGETEMFKFKCYGNGNLHLEFKRQDLLDLFNSIAGKSDRLGHDPD